MFVLRHEETLRGKMYTLSVGAVLRQTYSESASEDPFDRTDQTSDYPLTSSSSVGPIVVLISLNCIRSIVKTIDTITIDWEIITIELTHWELSFKTLKKTCKGARI